MQSPNGFSFLEMFQNKYAIVIVITFIVIIIDYIVILFAIIIEHVGSNCNRLHFLCNHLAGVTIALKNNIMWS